MRTAAFALLVTLVGALATEPAHAHHRSHSHVSVGVGFGFGYPYWGPGWWGPWGPWYYPPPYYYPSPVVVPAQPVQYIEKGSAPAAESWWYYCDASKGYYPYVKECPSGWQRVPPAPPPAK